MSRFFSDEAYEPQIDPFNAGEPVMPWDDPSALHDEGCELPADTGYAAEEKPQDNYRAPKRPATRHGEQPVEAPRADASLKTGTSPKQTAAASRKPGCARSVYKAVTLVVLAMILFNAFGSCASDVLENATDAATSDSDGADLEHSQEQANADEQAIADAIATRMDGLADDPAVVKLARQGLDTKLKSYLGYTAEELGIDADAYAAWFFSQLSYQVAYAYSYDDGTGSVSLDITSPVVYQIASELYDRSSYFMRSNKLYGSYDDTQAIPLTTEQQDQMRGFFADVLAGTEADNEGYLSAAVKKDTDGTWQLDETDFQDGLDYLLGVS